MDLHSKDNLLGHEEIKESFSSLHSNNQEEGSIAKDEFQILSSYIEGIISTATLNLQEITSTSQALSELNIDDYSSAVSQVDELAGGDFISSAILLQE